MKIALSGFFLDATGYGESSRRTLRALRAAGAEVVPGAVLNDGSAQLRPDAMLDEFFRTPQVALPDVHLINAAADQFVAYALHTLPAKRKVGYTCWETDSLHPSFEVGCEAMDLMIAPSTQTMNTLRAAGLRAACVPFHAIEHPEILPVDFGVPESTYVFYAIMTWQDRKNPIGLLTAYFTGFTGFDDVTLILKINGGPAMKQRVETQIDALLRMLNMPNPPRYKLVAGELTDGAMWALHQRGDCMVSMSRGEAFGVPLLDAFSMGNVVIAPDWGGQVDFLADACGAHRGVHLVKSRLTPVAQAYHYFTGAQHWADPDILDARTAMRAAFVMATDTHPKIRRDLSHLTPEAVGRQLLEVLSGD